MPLGREGPKYAYLEGGLKIILTLLRSLVSGTPLPMNNEQFRNNLFSVISTVDE